MGLSIHYYGQIRRVGMIEEVIDEVADISTSFGWKFQLLDGDNSDKLKGI